MASATKYQVAPTQDPDEGTWSQPPPSYGAGSSARDEDRLFGGGEARSSEDNIPDDFKFGGSVAEATLDIRNQFIRKVYTILTAQLIATGLVSSISFFNDDYKAWIQSHPALVFVSVRFYT
jgi:protein lifeguard